MIGRYFFATCFVWYEVPMCTRRFRPLGGAVASSVAVLASSNYRSSHVCTVRTKYVKSSVFVSSIYRCFGDRFYSFVSFGDLGFGVTGVAKRSKGARRATLFV